MNDLTKDPAEMQAKIVALEQEMLQHPEAHLALEPVHHFSKGIYARELLIPAGVLLTGKVHKHENLNIVNGDITVWTDEGMKRLTGHHILVSAPGTKRVGYAHADTIWTCVHATESTDLEEIERLMVCDSFDEYQQFLQGPAEMQALEV